MKCDSPHNIRLEKPIVSEEGGLIFNVPVRCGRCLPCKRTRINGWSFRLMKELERSQSALFVTLTYNTESVPLSDNGFMTLRKEDFQLFFKRLRYYEEKDERFTTEDLRRKRYGKDWKDKPIRYYLAAEYGSKRKRPHAHIILFNVRNTENVQKAWGRFEKVGSDWIRIQDFGSTYIDTDVNSNNIDYTLKYMDKVQQIGKFKEDDRVKEFSLISKGLGDNYLTEKNIKFHRDNIHLNYVQHERGYKVPIPRYYDRRIFKKRIKTDTMDTYINDRRGSDRISYIKKQVELQEKKDKRELGENYDRIQVLKKIKNNNILTNKIRNRDKD